MSDKPNSGVSAVTEYGEAVNPLLSEAFRNYDIMARSAAVNDDYRGAVKTYVNRLINGDEEDYPRALRKAIRELTHNGISTINYQSGHKQRMDSALRRDLMTEYTNIVQEVERKVGEDIGCDGWEISAHEHCAVDHEPIQGHTFTNEEFEKLQNGEPATDIEGEVFQTDRPIGMFNCRHIAFPVIIGISEPSFSSEELEALKERNEDGIEFNGEHYTLYEAEQEQRRLETEMRRTREELNMWKEVRELDPRNEREYQRVKARLAGLRNEYKELGSALQPKAIRMKMERSYVPKGSTGNPVIPPFFKTNTSLGAMAERFYVKTGMKTDRDSWHIQEGSYVTGVKVMAKGSKIDDVQRLIKTYPLQNGTLTKVEDWYKVRGTGIVTDNNIERLADLHWYYCPNIGKVEFKVKKYLDK